MMAHGHVTAGSISNDTLWLSTTEDHHEEDHHDDDHHHGVNATLAAAGMVGVGAFVVLFSIALMAIGFYFSERKRKQEELRTKRDIVDYMSRLRTTSANKSFSDDHVVQQTGHHQSNEGQSGHWGKLAHKLELVNLDSVNLHNMINHRPESNDSHNSSSKVTPTTSKGVHHGVQHIPVRKQKLESLEEHHVDSNMENIATHR